MVLLEGKEGRKKGKNKEKKSLGWISVDDDGPYIFFSFSCWDFLADSLSIDQFHAGTYCTLVRPTAAENI